jgi:hypothetical protein
MAIGFHFGILRKWHFSIFSPVLVSCTKKNLATLFHVDKKAMTSVIFCLVIWTAAFIVNVCIDS